MIEKGGKHKQSSDHYHSMVNTTISETFGDYI